MNARAYLNLRAAGIPTENYIPRLDRHLNQTQDAKFK